MEVLAVSGAVTSVQADALILYHAENSELAETVKQVDEALNGAVSEIISAGDFSGKVGEILVLYTRGAIPSPRLILVGTGSPEKFTIDTIRRAIASGLLRARALKAAHVVTVALGAGQFSLEQNASALTEGALLASYQYHGQKSSDAPADLPNTLSILDDDRNDLEKGIAAGKAFAEGTNLTRELVNLPPNILNPEYLANAADTMAQELGLKCSILEKGQMTALRMGALLGVAQGSEFAPRFIILEHKPELKGDDKTIVLVGKGVTFDTGGYSIKTADGMVGMKGDMGGGAAVIGAMSIIAKLDLPLHVVGLVPAADNMISDKAYRPQDVLTASNGKTIEIISTDAEGRLLLADALVYAQRYKPAAVVDIATLTGAMSVALGNPTAGFYTNDESLVGKLRAAGEATQERVWQMPIHDEYGEPIKSDTADIKNSGGEAGRAGGAGVAAYFLSQFVDYSWAHIDMAGMSRNDGLNPYHPKHSTKGYGARLLAEFVRNWA
jgi:leucyl aminopeptidase